MCWYNYDSCCINIYGLFFSVQVNETVKLKRVSIRRFHCKRNSCMALKDV